MAYIYGNLGYVSSSSSTILSGISTSNRFAFLFTPRASKTISSVYFRSGGKTGSPGTLRVGIQTISSGNPSGTWLNYTDVSGSTIVSGVNKIAISNTSVTSGTQYALVILPVSGTWDTSNYITYTYQSTSGNPTIESIKAGRYATVSTHTNHDYYDGSFVVKSGSTWGDAGYANHNGVEFTDGTYYGTLSGGSLSIYGADLKQGVRFVTDSLISISELSFLVSSSSTSSPADNLYYSISVDGSGVDSGIFVAQGVLTSFTPSWQSKILASPIIIEPGKTVIIGLNSPSSSSPYYLVYRAIGYNSNISLGGTNFQRVSGSTLSTITSTDDLVGAIEGNFVPNKTYTVDAIVLDKGDRYWVGGTGNWSNSSKWSRTSGGAGNVSPPTEHNKVIIDNNSGFGSGGTITIDANSYCADFDSSSCTHNFTINHSAAANSLNVIGSFKGSSGLTQTHSGYSVWLNLYGNFTPNNGQYALIKISGESFLLGSVNCIDFYIRNSFDSNNFNITASNWFGIYDIVAPTMRVDLGTSTITARQLWAWRENSTSSFFLDLIDVILKTTASSPSSYIEIGFEVYFNSITLVPFDASSYFRFFSTVYANGSFSPRFRAKSVTNTAPFLYLSFSTDTGSDNSYHFDSFDISGTSGSLVRIEPYISTDPAVSLVDSVGINECEYLEIYKINASGGAQWIAYNSVDSGGNTGWEFPLTITHSIDGDVIQDTAKWVSFDGVVKHLNKEKTYLTEAYLAERKEKTFTISGIVKDDISAYIKPGRIGKIFVGFDDEMIQVFDGVSKAPQTSISQKQSRVSFYDKMALINKYRLNYAGLKENIRTDLYIQDILTEMGYTSADWVMDEGLNTIPMAYYAGNTAGYEIKTACEAEGARFYQQEDGRFVFENRQHYNLNTEYKKSQWSFNYNNMTDLEIPNDTDNIINRVIITLKPRRKQALQEIANYYLDDPISGNSTIEFWITLDHPTVEIADPVATTDYVANSQSDGSGTNLTANITITTTKFAQAVLLNIENTGATSAYLTTLKLRGRPYSESSPIVIEKTDTTSIAEYGEKILEIENKYLSDKYYAESLAQSLLEKYSNPLHKMILRNPCIPQLKLGNIITVYNKMNTEYFLMRIIKIAMSMTPDEGFMQEITCRSVIDSELADLFTIGTSEIEGANIVSP